MAEIPVFPWPRARPLTGLSLTVLLGSTAALAGECRLALVLALDVSSSVDENEHRLQRQGLAAALVAPEVVRAFLSGGPVSLFIFEWSGLATQAPLLSDWRAIKSEEDLARVAAVLASHPRSGTNDPHRSTALGAALSFAANALQEGPDCQARTIDVSGDGESNEGFNPEFAYEHYPLDDVTVNALVVGGTLSDRGNRLNPGDLVAYFQAEVLHGPGAFSVLADGYEDYERAMRIKLRREVEMPAVSGLPSVEPQG